jgi:phage terminase small subunit
MAGKPVGRKPKSPNADREAEARRIAFAEAFIKELNVSAAAISAGFSPKTAAQSGSRLLADPRVQALIAERRAKIAARNDITIDRVINELAAIAFANSGDYFRLTSAGEPAVDFSELTPAQKAAIAEVVVEDFTEGRGEDAREVRRIRFKLHDKIAALVKIGQHLGMWKNIGPKNVTNITINQTVEMRRQAVDAEFKEILGSVDPIPLSPPARPGSGAEMVSGPVAPGGGKVGRARRPG